MDLVAQIKLIDARLLSAVTTAFPDPLTDEEKVAVNAYLVLAHACIEEFLEDTFLEHVQRLIDLMDRPLVPREVAGLFLAFGTIIPEKKRIPYAKRERAGVANVALTLYKASTIDMNHGVKPAKVRTLAEGAGVSWPEFESALAAQLADLDTLGAKRGEAGHLGPLTMKATKLSRRDYPDNVRGWVHDARDAGLAIRTYLDDRVAGQCRCLVAFDASV
ncbi:MAG TPA: hypothetical protein VGW75_18050 [Solirubrobacteraceae bacterium]|jgi:hypothetical protein|nr:hypothetical protein [Solirubrobacteraceae bacterium]